MILKTNSGDIEASEVAEVEGFGEVWFHEDCLTNIVALKDLMQKNNVNYKSEE